LIAEVTIDPVTGKQRRRRRRRKRKGREGRGRGEGGRGKRGGERKRVLSTAHKVEHIALFLSL